jgi:regulation of enolase protein 1 (concanavalin A-like superfamily)
MKRIVRQTRGAPGSSAARTSGTLRSCLFAVLLVFCGFSALYGTALVAQADGQRVVQGKVLGADAQPLPGAVIYLKDGKTNTIKTGIATQDGSFRFGQLSTDTDYSLWAQFQGKKSSTKNISSFDSKKLFFINLKIDK